MVYIDVKISYWFGNRIAFDIADEVSDTEYKTILDETYLTSPKDMVLAVSIAKSYPDAIKTEELIEKIPIDSPYIQSTYIDYHYHGFCTVISFTELLKSFKNLTSSVEKDTSFFTVVWLKVCILIFSFKCPIIYFIKESQIQGKFLSIIFLGN